MRKIVKESLALEVYEVSEEEAIAYMKENGENWKLELIEGLPEGERISFYRQGGLCGVLCRASYHEYVAD